MKNTWRDICAPLIREILEEHKTSDEATLRRALFEAYPFGLRRYHPYKIWLDEIKRQRFPKRYHKLITDNPNQLTIL